MHDRSQSDDPTSWIAEIPTDAGPPWLRMGTRGLSPAEWLVVDRHRDRELAEKRSLLARHADDVGAWEPGTEAAAAETLDLVQAWLRRHHPDLPTEPDTGARHPLEAAALLVQEDLCLVDDVGHRLVAGSVCFPSHWVLREKLGHPMAVVHAPVPHYRAALEARVDTFLARLPHDRIVARRNVSVHDHPDLYRPEPAETYEQRPPGAGPEGLWLRSERQTLRRLTRSGAVLFTIRTQVAPMAALAAHPTVAAGFARRVDALVEEATAAGRPPHVPPGLGSWLRSCR